MSTVVAEAPSGRVRRGPRSTRAGRGSVLAAVRRALATGRFSWSDRVAGWFDGRRGLPLVVMHDRRPEVVPSGHLRAIEALASAHLDDRLGKLMTQTADDRVEHASARPRREYLTARIADHTGQLDVLLAAGPDRDRRMGERRLAEAHVVRRRAAEHDRRIRELRSQITEAGSELAALETRQLQLAAQVGDALATAQSDAKAVLSAADRRAANYLKGACRTHPDPASLIAPSAHLMHPQPDWIAFRSAKDLMSTFEEDAT